MNVAHVRQLLEITGGSQVAILLVEGEADIMRITCSEPFLTTAVLRHIARLSNRPEWLRDIKPEKLPKLILMTGLNLTEVPGLMVMEIRDVTAIKKKAKP